MIKRIIVSLNALFLFFSMKSIPVRAEEVTIIGNEQQVTVGEFINIITTKIMQLAKEFGGLLILIAVLMVGFEVIRHRDDEEKRKSALVSLLWLAVGAFIIGSSVVIANILYNGVGL